jgi:hypothetical protein
MWPYLVSGNGATHLTSACAASYFVRPGADLRARVLSASPRRRRTISDGWLAAWQPPLSRRRVSYATDPCRHAFFARLGRVTGSFLNQVHGIHFSKCIGQESASGSTSQRTRPLV